MWLPYGVINYIQNAARDRNTVIYTQETKKEKKKINNKNTQ